MKKKRIEKVIKNVVLNIKEQEVASIRQGILLNLFYLKQSVDSLSVSLKTGLTCGIGDIYKYADCARNGLFMIESNQQFIAGYQQGAGVAVMGEYAKGYKAGMLNRKKLVRKWKKGGAR